MGLRYASLARVPNPTNPKVNGKGIRSAKDASRQVLHPIKRYPTLRALGPYVFGGRDRRVGWAPRSRNWPPWHSEGAEFFKMRDEDGTLLWEFMTHTWLPLRMALLSVVCLLLLEIHVLQQVRNFYGIYRLDFAPSAAREDPFLLKLRVATTHKIVATSMTRASRVFPYSFYHVLARSFLTSKSSHIHGVTQ